MTENPLSVMQQLDPEFIKHLQDTNQLIYTEGALPKKFKLLMAMAFDAAHGAEGGVRALANAAVREGTTKQEIAEALRVAYYLAGVGTLYTASRALEELVE
jgi:alkylhydroperoxidase/carboxymuconolactone decarboxylase family protein YurZ